MGSPGRHNTQTNGLKATGGSLDGNALSSQPGTYTQHVSKDGFQNISP
jgi:hypothetical protein